MRRFIFCFFALNLLLSFYYVDIWNNSNTTSRALPVVTFFENGTLQIDKYHKLTLDKAHIDGHYYTDKAPLPTLLIIPFFGALKFLGIIMEIDGSLYSQWVYILGSLICGSIPFVFYILLSFLKIRKQAPGLSPVLLSMLPFYASFVFVFSGTYFAHVLSGFLLLVAYIFIKDKKYFLSGLLCGLAFLSEYTIVLIFPIWALQILIKEKSFKRVCFYSLGILPSVVFILLYNYHYTGSPFEMLYKYHTFQDLHTNYGFSFPTFKSLWGLTFSNYKGLFFYTPFLLLFLFYLIKAFNLKKFLNHYLTYVSIIYFLFIASYFGWWGGWTYGPRLLFPIAVLLLYEGIIWLSKRKFSKSAFWALTIFGLAGAFMAKITVVYSIPTESLHPFIRTIFPQIEKLQLNPNNLMTMIFGINPIISAVIWALIFTGILIFLTKWFNRLRVETSLKKLI